MSNGYGPGHVNVGNRPSFVRSAAISDFEDPEDRLEDALTRMLAEGLLNTQAIQSEELAALQAARERQHALVLESDAVPFTGRVDPATVAEWFKTPVETGLTNRVKDLLEGPNSKEHP